jgi:ABC-type phosphate transport system substrate-binding protein
MFAKVRLVAVIVGGLLAGSLPITEGSAGEKGHRLVVNAARSDAHLTRAQVADLFLGKARRWPDGTQAAPVDQSATSPVRQSFSADVLGRPVNGILTHWQQQIMSGRGVPPPVKQSDQDVLAVVAGSPGGIGYVAPETSLGPGVKFLDVEE